MDTDPHEHETPIEERPVGWERVETETLDVELEYDPHVNYAMQQNAVPVLKALRIVNGSELPLEGVTVVVWAAPELAPRTTFSVPAIPAKGAHRFDALDVPFSATRLVNKDERERAHLWVEVSLGDDTLFRRAYPLEVLAYSEWAGSASLPEILASFVLPNHPDVDRLLARASTLLGARTGDPSLSGYQRRDPQRVRATLRAIWESAVELDLAYVNPPASFGARGQKIRTPDRILDVRLGTCLDLVLFVAAACEQAGLNPLLVLLEEHAVLGVWAEADSFPFSTVDEGLRVRKRVELDAIVVVETTGLTTRPPMSFDEACAAAERRLRDPEAFEYAVDVHAARRERIHPLPGRASEARYVPIEGSDADPSVAPDLTARPPVVVPPTDVSEPLPVGPARVERWKRKLLDLTLRNRLLNFRMTKRAIPLLVPDIAQLEDRLAAGRSFQVGPAPDVMGAADPRDARVHLDQTAEDAREAYLGDELDEGRLHSDLTQAELDKRLVTIDRAARVSLEEGGANTLFLALGFLVWSETKAPDVERRAPILLLPLEITRAGVREGYRIAVADEDPQVNVTLLQKLKVDFDLAIEGLETLDTDDSGIDVGRILRRVREAVLPMDGWHVLDESVLGLFSFTKHLMWRDLADRANVLTQNPVVKHLVDHPSEPYPGGHELPPLDVGRDPATTYCPLDADSSQLRAIHAAADGHTFVLEGPPGTGKSQTIANLIAHALGNGQRVLFVSEKMAALSVVYKRLSRLGLSPFCLELHSNKTQKRKILQQLREALEFESDDGATGFTTAAGRLDDVQGELTRYVRCLHDPRSFGVSLYDGLCAWLEHKGAPRLDFDVDGVDAVDAVRLRSWRDAVRALGVALGEVGTPGIHAYRGVGLDAWTPGLPDRVVDVAQAFEAASAALGETAQRFATALDLEECPLSASSLDDLHALGRALLESPRLPAALLRDPAFDVRIEAVRHWIKTLRACQAARADVLEVYRASLFDLDLGELLDQLRSARDTFWPLTWFRGRAPKKALRRVLATGRLAPTAELVGQVERAIEALDLEHRLDDYRREALPLLGAWWRGRESDADKLERAVTWSLTVEPHLARLGEGDPVAEAALRARFASAAENATDTFAEGSELRRSFTAFHEAQEDFDEKRRAATELLEIEPDVVFGAPSEPDLAERSADAAAGWRKHVRQLREWCAWRRARAVALDLDLDVIVAAAESGTVTADTVRAAFEHSFHGAWVERVYAAEPMLSGFNAAEQDDRVRRFRELDVKVRDQSADVVREHLADRLPSGEHTLARSSTSEVGVLLRELKKQRRHKSIRSLFQLIPNLLPRLKPCLLMSPLSVAQYLGPDFPPFDLVVFDEASQIPTWDAVGAIARGTRLIVVGDSKQLPPTTFFMRLDDDEPADEGDIEELESILDECSTIKLPKLSLGWHYRSRHESLIAFSNHHYYQGELFTFPAAAHEAPHLGVHWRHVPDGVYDKSHTRTNRAEAEAVVAEIVARLLDPATASRSIGVVTFSLAQQTLIQDLLEVARRQDTSLERYFTDTVDEPVFVKNLENVQGDERDVILFSICYGPDPRGRVAMNFGPLNREGGERRLNVAVTRAREQVIVFSTLTADRIDLSKTRAVGVAHLKSFLSYAERGAVALDQAVGPTRVAQEPTTLEIDLRRALEREGLEVDARVGCSGYRIDLGIKDPVDPGRYLLGVETDGPMYDSGQSVRDRDRTRFGVLGHLGWRLERVWCTEWWQEPEKQVARILARLREGAEAAAAAEEPTPAALKETPPIPDAHVAPVQPASNDRAGADDVPYTFARHSGRRGTPDAFHARRSDARILRVIVEILAHEGPISTAWLVRRVAERFGIERVTERVEERVIGLLQAVPHQATWTDDAEFLWHPGQAPETYRTFRAAPDDASPERDVDHVPAEEVANAAFAVLRGQISMPVTDLARETARRLGYLRLGSTVKRRMELGILCLVDRGDVRRRGDEVVLP